MAKAKVKKGDTIWVMIPRFARVGLPPQEGKIVVLSNTPGKQVGVEFKKPEVGVHNCDGHSKKNNCLFVRPKDVMSKKQAEAFIAEQKEAMKHLKAVTVDEVDELELDI